MTDQQDKKEVQFLPFNAVNEFMLDDYRLGVIRTVFEGLQTVSNSRKKAINNMVKKYVKVPGFRNSAQAPLPIKIKNAVSVFQKRSDFTAQVLAAFAEIKSDLSVKVCDLLDARGWECLPVDADRTKLPGFLITWPKEDTYDALHETFFEKYPDEKETQSTDDISLLVIWLGGRLPYSLFSEDEEVEETA